MISNSIEYFCFTVYCSRVSFFNVSVLLLKNRIVTTLFKNPKRLVKLGNINTCAEVKLCLFMPALEIVCRKTEVLNTVSSG